MMWRAFVYSTTDDDRAKQAYDEFKPLDGKFATTSSSRSRTARSTSSRASRSIPLFGAMPRTPLAMEVQITKEYLGFTTHLAYLGTLWEEVLRSRHLARRRREDRRSPIRSDAMAGVANTGTDRNWTGSHFDQANWYAFGRLAWNPRQPAARSPRNGRG